MSLVVTLSFSDIPMESASKQSEVDAKRYFGVVELHHLRSFVRAVELGSFNAAAQSLSYTGPAISQHVAAIEQELGVAVLVRQARGVTPTAAGTILHERARHLLDQADGIVKEVRDAARAPTTVRVGAFSTAAQFLLPPVLSRLLTTHPDLEVVLIDREPPEGFADVHAGRLDVTVTHRYSGIEPIDPHGLRVETLLHDGLVLLVPADHPAQDGADLGSFADERWISGPPDAQNHVALEWAAARVGFVPEVAFETTDYAVTTTLVASGLGPAFVPRLTLERMPEGVRPVELADDCGLERVISLVYREPVRSDTLGLVLDELRAAGRSASMMEP